MTTKAIKESIYPIPLCPRCLLDELSEVDGWVEYGDQIVDIVRIGCLSCGYVEYEEDDYYEEE